MFRGGARFAALVALAALAACDDQVQIEKVHSVHTDVRAIATQARGAGDILWVVDGAGSIGSPEPVMNAVRDAIQGRPGSVNPSYTLAAEAAGQDISMVRVVLNGPKAMKSADICRGEGADSNQDNETRVALAFCQSERALSSIKGRAPKATGPDDPKFVELLQTAARELFPAPDRD
ncbi:MAG: hypothetical protein ACR2RA_13240 [Geminicoccaceae bacterium]